MGKIIDWLLGKNGGGILNGIISGAASAYNTWQSSRNIDKSLAAQSKENQKNREYNFDLAKYQNAENLAQWSRENAYNSPSAQKQRLEAAGLNPDLMYGGSGVMNTAAASPQLTSGAPSSPMDWSSLANKKTIGNAIMESLAIEQARANVRKTNAEAGVTEVGYDEAKRRFGLNFTQEEYNKLKGEVDTLLATANNLNKDTEVKDFELGLQKQFGSAKLQAEINSLKKKYDLDNKQLEYLTQTFSARVSQVNSTADISAVEATLEKYGFGFLQDFVPFISNILELYNQYKGMKGGKDSSYGSVDVGGY